MIQTMEWIAPDSGPLVMPTGIQKKSKHSRYYKNNFDLIYLHLIRKAP